jgi:hypothetical protein
MKASAERGRGRRAAAPVAAASVLFKDPKGTRAKRVRPGFAWDLFLLTPVFGAPLFLRGLPHWGAAILGLWLADLILGWLAPAGLKMAVEVALFASFLGLQLWLGFMGNALTARACRARGWTAADARDPAVKRALEHWHIDD